MRLALLLLLPLAPMPERPPGDGRNDDGGGEGNNRFRTFAGLMRLLR